MSQCRYRLVLELVEDDGDTRYFAVNCGFDSQVDIRRLIAQNIARALRSTMDSPPSALELAGAMEGDCDSLTAGLSYAHKKWDGENAFEDCVKIIVDVDKLCSMENDRHKYGVKVVLMSNGIGVVPV